MSFKGTSVTNGEIRAAVATGSREYQTALGAAPAVSIGPEFRVTGMGHETVWLQSTVAGVTADVQFKKGLNWYTVDTVAVLGAGVPFEFHYYEAAYLMRVVLHGAAGAATVMVKLGEHGAT